jgi:hypothetical protein
MLRKCILTIRFITRLYILSLAFIIYKSLYFTIKPIVYYPTLIKCSLNVLVKLSTFTAFKLKALINV